MDRGTAPVMPSTTRTEGILVIGCNRSGTKWLSNILCNHSQIVGLQNKANSGIIETNLLGNFERVVGDLQRPDHYVALIEMLAQTDFFKAARVDKALLYTLRPRPKTCVDVFRVLAEAVAQRERKRFWLQKAPPSMDPALLAALPTARIVVIRRNMLDVVASAMRAWPDQGSYGRRAISYALDERCLQRIRRERNAIEVSYEELRDETPIQVKRICQELGIEYEPAMLDQRFPPNTSFSNAERAPLPRRAALVTRTAARVGYLLPAAVLLVLRNWLSAREPRFVGGTFAEIVERYQLSEADVVPSSRDSVGAHELHQVASP